jgi:hypothetical protein
MSGHTPGPWYVDVGCSKRIAYIYPETTKGPRPIIAEIPLGVMPGKTQGTSNTHAIAAVPELLEACKAALEFLREDLENNDPDGNWEAMGELQQVGGTLFWAVEKAEGRR